MIFLIDVNRAIVNASTSSFSVPYSLIYASPKKSSVFDQSMRSTQTSKILKNRNSPFRLWIQSGMMKNVDSFDLAITGFLILLLFLFLFEPYELVGLGFINRYVCFLTQAYNIFLARFIEINKY
uniref:Uncharacterized protein n=1 Tax=Glossina brevipalpis TaxID=37001 RepID=A0A1A9WE73_9MUSC